MAGTRGSGPPFLKMLDSPLVDFCYMEKSGDSFHDLSHAPVSLPVLGQHEFRCLSEGFVPFGQFLNSFVGGHLAYPAPRASSLHGGARERQEMGILPCGPFRVKDLGNSRDGGIDLSGGETGHDPAVMVASCRDYWPDRSRLVRVSRFSAGNAHDAAVCGAAISQSDIRFQITTCLTARRRLNVSHLKYSRWLRSQAIPLVFGVLGRWR